MVGLGHKLFRGAERYLNMLNLGLELFRGVERDLNMLKTAFITKSPCLFLEKNTLKKKNGVRGHGFT